MMSHSHPPAVTTYLDPLDSTRRFPVLSPVNGSAGSPAYQPICLGDGVWYVNAMESVASAMEGSIIAGRNLALTLAKQNSQHFS